MPAARRYLERNLCHGLRRLPALAAAWACLLLLFGEPLVHVLLHHHDHGDVQVAGVWPAPAKGHDLADRACPLCQSSQALVTVFAPLVMVRAACRAVVALCCPAGFHPAHRFLAATPTRGPPRCVPTC